MPKAEIKPATSRAKELHAAHVARLDGIASSTARLAVDRMSMAPEDVVELSNRLRDAVREARKIGEVVPAARINPVVMDVYRVLMRVETQINLIRESLLDRVEEAEVDPSGSVARKLAEIAAQTEQAAAIVAGRGRAQA